MCLKESGVVSMVVNVLLVDDEPQIRKLLANLLLSRDRSYQVITASSGEEALDLSRNRSERIDILITDIDMGEMSGIELYTHIREEPPETEVLFISAMAHCIRESLPVLQKPFKPRQFVAKVAEVLSTPKPDGSPRCRCRILAGNSGDGDPASTIMT